jgi:hypothetical protein
MTRTQYTDLGQSGGLYRRKFNNKMKAQEQTGMETSSEATSPPGGKSLYRTRPGPRDLAIYKRTDRRTSRFYLVTLVSVSIILQVLPCFSDPYLRVHLTPSSPILSPSSRTFADINPHQLAPTVGTLGVGFMDSMAFSPSSQSNSMVDKNQIYFGSIDF